MRWSTHLYAYTWHLRKLDSSKYHSLVAPVGCHRWEKQRLQWYGFMKYRHCLSHQVSSKQNSYFRRERLSAWVLRLFFCNSLYHIFQFLIENVYSICFYSSSKRVKLLSSDTSGELIVRKKETFCRVSLLYLYFLWNKKSEALLTRKNFLPVPISKTAPSQFHNVEMLNWPVMGVLLLKSLVD